MGTNRVRLEDKVGELREIVDDIEDHLRDVYDADVTLEVAKDGPAVYVGDEDPYPLDDLIRDLRAREHGDMDMRRELIEFFERRVDELKADLEAA